MTPKEKAEELYDKMYGKTPVRNLIIQIEEDKQYAKQCALVAVDEIIITRTSGVEFFYYWNEVKKEIQNL
jgi:hypothetical protein